MHEVSKAINTLDTTKDIDGKICKDKWVSDGGGTSNSGSNVDTAGKCYSGGHSSSSAAKLSEMFDESLGGNKNNYATSKSESMQEHTSTTISKDISALTRDQHGVVSSAFAKA
ncbi:hypothetical protein, partial [Anaplasma bovis]|uniref:hypothetical protein n=1 Tax=Anaplasma bovis TaxID=186733 RepID=UPI002FF2344E